MKIKVADDTKHLKQQDLPRNLWLVPVLLIATHSLLIYFKNEFWGDLGTPFLLIWLALSIIPVVRSKVVNFRSAFYFMLGILSYASAELIWTFLDRFLQIDPESSLFLS